MIRILCAVATFLAPFALIAALALRPDLVVYSILFSFVALPAAVGAAHVYQALAE
jgi:hypothetical protein